MLLRQHIPQQFVIMTISARRGREQSRPVSFTDKHTTKSKQAGSLDHDKQLRERTAAGRVESDMPVQVVTEKAVCVYV